MLATPPKLSKWFTIRLASRFIFGRGGTTGSTISRASRLVGLYKAASTSFRLARTLVRTPCSPYKKLSVVGTGWGGWGDLSWVLAIVSSVACNVARLWVARSSTISSSSGKPKM